LDVFASKYAAKTSAGLRRVERYVQYREDGGRE
jgi:hypothetical protein